MPGELQYAKKSAIVLDANPQMRAILRSILNMMGLRSVAEFSDPTSARHHLQGQHVDVAILDLALEGGTDGLKLAWIIRHDAMIVNPTMPIILVSSYVNGSLISKAINVGVDEMVTKPLRARDLISRVEKTIRRPRPYIRTPTGYFGPDRRRRADPMYAGPERRVADLASVVKTDADARKAIQRVEPDPVVQDPEPVKPLRPPVEPIKVPAEPARRPLAPAGRSVGPARRPAAPVAPPAEVAKRPAERQPDADAVFMLD